MSETTQSSPATGAAPAALWEDFVDVFTSPATVFARRRDGRAGLAMLLYTILGVLTFYVGRPVMQPVFDRQISAATAKIEADPKLTAEQKESVTSKMRNFSDSPLTYIGPALILPLSLLVTALLLWGVAKGFGSAASYGQALAVTSIGGIPRAVLGLLTVGAFAATGHTITNQYALSLNPSALLGPDASEVLAAVLGRLDIGVLWHTVLLGIGIAIVGRIERPKGLSAAGLVWLIAGLFAVLNALRAVAAMS